ncbi:MAG: Ig-like domain repeat protein [Janthinobacterium lividum]
MLNIDPSAGFASYPADPSSTIARTLVVAAFGSLQAAAGLDLTISLNNQAFVPTTFSLPVLRIDTSGVPVLSKETAVSGTVTLTSADGQKSYLPNAANMDNTANLHVHGNSTAQMPKLPYTIKFNTSLDLLTLLGVKCPFVTSTGKPVCDKSKSYVLLANYDDKTLLRDWSAFTLANSIPFGSGYLSETAVPSSQTGVIPTPSGTSALLPWAPHSVFVELFLNGAYEGVYQLAEKLNVDSHRVNITELTETATSEDLSGGYLLEIDQHRDEAFVFTTPRGLPIGLIDPDFSPHPEVPQQTSYIANYVNAAEDALFSPTFTDPVSGWRSYFDEASVVNYYLINEIMGNVDGGNFYSSTYLYKDKDNPFLYMGPVWDFDISSGNVSYAAISNPTVPWVENSAPWYTQWFRDPALRSDVVKQFNALKNNGVLTSWLDSINSQASSLEQAQTNNFTRWPILGNRVWPNAQAANSYDGEVAYLSNYLKLRISYLDSLFNGKAQTATSLELSSTTFSAGTLQTFTGFVTGPSGPTGNVTFLLDGLVFAAVPINGAGAFTLTTNKLRPGEHVMAAVYNGDNTSALSSSNPLSVIVTAAPVPTVTSLSVSSASGGAGAPVSMKVSIVNTSGTTLPTGTVSFSSNGTFLGTSNLSNGVATFSTSLLPTGLNVVQAFYLGTSDFEASTSSVVSLVSSAPVPLTTSTSLVLSGASMEFGSSLTLTSTVTPAAATGTVTFYDGKNVIGSSFLNDGSAIFVTSALQAGSHDLSAYYGGAAGFTPSTSPTATVTVSPVTSSPWNLLVDPGFESQTSHTLSSSWIPSGPSSSGVDINSGYSHTGVKNAFIWDSSWSWNAISQDVSVRPNTDYVFSGWVRSGLVANRGYFSVLGGKSIISETSFGNLGEYTKLLVRFNSGVNTSVSARVGFWGANTVQWIQIDDLALTPNLLVDPGFEAQTSRTLSSSWIPSGPSASGVDINLGYSHTGGKNGFIWDSSSSWNAISQDVPVRPNTDYVFSGWVRSGLVANLGYFSVLGGKSIISETSFGNLGEYTNLLVRFNSGLNTSVSTRVGFWGANTAQWIQIDDFTLEQVP